MPDDRNALAILMDQIRSDLLHRAQAASAPSTATISAEAPVYTWGQDLGFSAGANGTPYLANGWSTPEPEFTWSDGNNAEIIMAIVPSDGLFRGEIFCTPFIQPQRPRQRIRLSVESVVVGEWEVIGAATLHFISDRPRHCDRLRLKFQFPDAVSPRQIGISEDPRNLSIALRRLKLTQLFGHQQ